MQDERGARGATCFCRAAATGNGLKACAVQYGLALALTGEPDPSYADHILGSLPCEGDQPWRACGGDLAAVAAASHQPAALWYGWRLLVSAWVFNIKVDYIPGEGIVKVIQYVAHASACAGKLKFALHVAHASACAGKL